MKHALLLIGLTTSLAAAGPRPRPLAADTLELRAGRRAQYLTDALQLSGRQAQALRRSLARPTPAAPELERTLLRILTPGQYNAYVWLRESTTR